MFNKYVFHVGDENLLFKFLYWSEEYTLIYISMYSVVGVYFWNSRFICWDVKKKKDR